MSSCVVPPHGVTDANKCFRDNSCGSNAYCPNPIESYTCTCHTRYTKQNTTSRTCIGETFVCVEIVSVFSVTTVKRFLNHIQYNESSSTVFQPLNFPPDIDECEDGAMPNERVCGINGTCGNTNKSFRFECPTGFTNYGNERTPCSGNAPTPFCEK